MVRIGIVERSLEKLCSYVRYRGKKPQSLGEGLQRVVRAAGGGKSGKFKWRSHPLAEEKTLCGPRVGRVYSVKANDVRLNVRHYDNGVQIRYGRISSLRNSGNGVSTMSHDGNGLLGVFKPNLKLYAAQSSSNRVIGAPVNSCEAAFKTDTRDAFKLLEPTIYI